MEPKEKDLLRIVFLKLFTKEIIRSLAREEIAKQKIEVEKLKDKIAEPKEDTSEKKAPSVEQAFREIIKNPEKKSEIKRKVIIHRENIPDKSMQRPIPPAVMSMPREKEGIQKPKTPENEKPKQAVEEVGSFEAGMQKSISGGEEYHENKIRQQIKNTQPKQILKQFLQKTPAGPPKSPIEKITPFLRDNTIVSIECSGPGKNILVKKYNQVNVTKVSLTEQEIKSIIEYFAKEAKIPLVGGILKAAVGNNIISAVISDFVGSRFVINKLTPYSLINQNRR